MDRHSHTAWWEAKNALMSKPDGDDTSYCSSCRGEGCDDCLGWGWTQTPGYCRLPATGHPCSDCANRKGCRA
jgi:hypothetical protein